MFESDGWMDGWMEKGQIHQIYTRMSALCLGDIPIYTPQSSIVTMETTKY